MGAQCRIPGKGVGYVKELWPLIGSEAWTEPRRQDSHVIGVGLLSPTRGRISMGKGLWLPTLLS